ncbi:hypothetical protein RGU12_21605 [Fredinandcohnia sp. QZ13]|uniref:hypothetical protein n=1 Tax=Fredinandcohnia sp. QZ13 TaxID=3073144 RepID=UPI0028532A3B|nr:hypothetical protein [Fredinandcohnia sp. QZ13]MDR4890097.1 hypothetical protein [Fredinandcohnia sp. QZ13]
MTYLLFVIFLGILILQFVWVKKARTSKTLILPILFSLVYLSIIIFKLDFGTFLIPFTVLCIVLWLLFIWKLYINKRG